jgi:hypothetical protein
MIRTLLYILILTLTSLNALSLSPSQTSILKIDKDRAVIANASNLPIGSSGIVIHSFDDRHQAIIAKAILQKKEGDIGFVKLTPYDNLTQEALPTYKIPPKVGDKVIMNYLYNRALPITPNSDSYKTVTQSYSSIEWIHPDLFAARLASSFDPSPDREAFEKECKNDDIGLLFFHIDRRGYFVDCNTFKVVDTIPLPKAKDIQKPFYNRIEKIRGRVFGLFGSKNIKDYDSYYSKLLGLKNVR